MSFIELETYETILWPSLDKSWAGVTNQRPQAEAGERTEGKGNGKVGRKNIIIMITNIINISY